MLLCYLKSYTNCCIISFKRVETGETFVFELSKRYNDFQIFLKFMRSNNNELFIGYNMENFYNIIFNFIFSRYNSFLNENSSVIAYYIYNTATNLYSEFIDKNWKYSKYYNSIDLMKVLCDRDTSITFTEIEMYMNKEDVSDFKFITNDSVIEYKIDELRKYCIDKLDFLLELYKIAKSKIENRIILCNLFKVNILNKYDTGIGQAIIEKLILKTKTLDKESLFELKKNGINDGYLLNDIIVKDIEFSNKNFKDFLLDIKNIKVKDPLFKLNSILKFDNYSFNINAGGLEYVCDKKIIDNDSNRIIRIDISNAYPTLMYKYKIYPDFLPSLFEEVFDIFYKNRIDKKNDKNVTKLPLLGIFGNIGNSSSYLYSPRTFTSITLNLKLIILQLIESFYSNNIEILYVKTDEIIVRINKDQYSSFINSIKQWKKKYEFDLHIEEFEKIIIKDVNDMILYKKGYKENPNFNMVETRGCFNIKSKKVGVNLNAPIISKCIINFFGKKTPIMDTINSNNNIYDYLFYYKSNRQFKIIDKDENIEYQKIGRFFVSNKGSFVYKNNIEKKTFSILNESKIVICNKKPIFENINKLYYYHIANSLKEIIQPLQQKLF